MIVTIHISGELKEFYDDHSVYTKPLNMLTSSLTGRYVINIYHLVDCFPVTKCQRHR